MKTETFKKGFTLAELLTAIAIIAILVGILLPALNMARKFANDTKQKAMLSTIETGIIMFKNDNGGYPPSHGLDSSGTEYYPYCGAQTLTEAMLGQDLLGFHTDSIFREDGDGKDASDKDLYKLSGLSDDKVRENLAKRKGPYLSRENIGVFQPRDVFDPIKSGTDLVEDKYLICDVYTVVNKTITLPDGRPSTNKFKIGTPILYFRANTAALEIDIADASGSIYDFADNAELVAQDSVKNHKRHEGFVASNYQPYKFYDYIRDEVSSTDSRKRPVRPDSFLLISAGADGFYGTTDDICNFTPNLQ